MTSCPRRALLTDREDAPPRGRGTGLSPHLPSTVVPFTCARSHSTDMCRMPPDIVPAAGYRLPKPYSAGRHCGVEMSKQLRGGAVARHTQVPCKATGGSLANPQAGSISFREEKQGQLRDDSHLPLTFGPAGSTDTRSKACRSSAKTFFTCVFVPTEVVQAQGPRSLPPQALRPSAPAARQTSSTSLASTAASSPYCIYFLFAKLHLSPQRLSHQKPHGGTEGADVGLCLLSGFSLRAKQVKESASNT